MGNGSDINVGSIEKDIKILKELMEDVELTFAGWVDILNEREKKALKNLLQDYARQKQINGEYKKENELLREKVKKLEEQVEYDKTHIYTPMTIQLNYIPKQKIKDKIENLEKEYKKLEQSSDFIIADTIQPKIEVLQELLQEEDK
mgnify:CR=1 FL=1